jgi:type II secretory ATPase GspE/PulE/Tfp pilus assembly ATPase PilB-like protein
MIAVNTKELLQNLVKKKILTQEKADFYEVDSLSKNNSIVDYFLDKNLVKKEDVLNAIGEVKKIPVINILQVAVDPEALGLVPLSVAKQYNIIPYTLDKTNNSLVIVTDDPYNLTLKNFLEKKTNKNIVFYFDFVDDIRKAIELNYLQSLSTEVNEALRDVSSSKTAKFDNSVVSVYEAPITKIVNTILEFSVRSRASDIHIEPGELKTRVRYRIDGILHEKLILPKEIHDSLVSRIKILSEMKIDEKRVPQDGRFTYRLGDDEVDLRVSTLPTVYGEKIVMRLLKKTGGLPSLYELGLRGTQLKDLEEAITKPYGIILVTGPTGSGKTTTLYSVLSRLNQPGVNIVTLEDPVEYQIAGINQVQINPQAGLTFATGLRAFLRQDPNIILVGEIRDRETTQLAIQAALTGHLVFSTLHTNDAATAIPRLIDLGAEVFLIASVLNAVIAQRIVRRVCSYCKQPYQPPQEVIEEIKKTLGPHLLKEYQEKPINLFKGAGCSECNNTGYLGRIGIFEVLKITPKINKLILAQASAKDIQQQALEEGMMTMKQDGYWKVLDGMTTVEEVLRVAEI